MIKRWDRCIDKCICDLQFRPEHDNTFQRQKEFRHISFIMRRMTATTCFRISFFLFLIVYRIHFHLFRINGMTKLLQQFFEASVYIKRSLIPDTELQQDRGVILSFRVKVSDRNFYKTSHTTILFRCSFQPFSSLFFSLTLPFSTSFLSFFFSFHFFPILSFSLLFLLYSSIYSLLHPPILLLSTSSSSLITSTPPSDYHLQSTFSHNFLLL